MCCLCNPLAIPQVAKCPKCGVNPSGKRSCCGSGGSWSGKCGDLGDYKEHTWFEGLKVCQIELAESLTQAQVQTATVTPNIGTSLSTDVFYIANELNSETSNSIATKCAPIALLIIICLIF